MEKENLKVAIMNKLDLVCFSEFDELYKYLVFQFIMDYIKRIIEDEKYFQFGNYTLNTIDEILVINVGDDEISIEKMPLDQVCVSIWLQSFKKIVASIEVISDDKKISISYSVGNEKVQEKFSYDFDENKFSYEYTKNNIIIYSGYIIDTLDITNNIMDIFKILVLEKDKSLNEENENDLLSLV